MPLFMFIYKTRVQRKNDIFKSGLASSKRFYYIKKNSHRYKEKKGDSTF